MGLASRIRNPELGRRRCESKIRYPSWDVAEVAACLLLEDLRGGKLRRQKPGNVFAYRCRYCESWHVGHTVRPKNPWNHWASAMEAHTRRINVPTTATMSAKPAPPDDCGDSP